MKTTIVLLVYIIVVSGQLDYIHKVIDKVNAMTCIKKSPKYEIMYSQEKVHYQKGVYFCDKYSKRSCCGEKNFNELKLKWFREYSNIYELSTKCQEAYQEVVCSECDGDIGQKLRVGYCPQFCNSIYKACLHDLFSYDEKQKLRFCSQSDVVCSQLKYILKDGSEFCTSMGLKVNSYTNTEEWLENMYLNLPTEPLCWDGTSSSKIWGNGVMLHDEKRTYGFILSVLITIILLI